jgi:16S rRNA (guanine1207-N2)-methyltransferase
MTISTMPRHLLNPTSDLFTRYAQLEEGESALLLHSDDSGLGRWLVEGVGATGRVIVLHTSHSALNRFRRASGLAVSDAVYPDPAQHGPADAALLDIPKGREHVRAYLWAAALTLRPGGRLYLAGSNAAGAKSAISDAAELFGDAPVLGVKSSHRIALALRPDRVTIPAAWATTSPLRPQMRFVRRPEGEFTIVTMPGIFSWDHLDDGTALLLDHLGAQPEDDVLDLGCGYGIIGLAAARAGARVTLIDDDLLAVRCARASIRANELQDRCEALPGDVTDAVRHRQFDLILSNPPFHQGVDVSTGVASRIVRESVDLMRPGGRLRIVANRFLPYDRAMREIFGNARTIADNGRCRVLESIR